MTERKGGILIVNFKCTKCSSKFDCDVGTVCFAAEAVHPAFDKDIVCPRCGILNIESGQVELTQKGQTQLTNLHLAEEGIDLYKGQTAWLDEELAQRTDGEKEYDNYVLKQLMKGRSIKKALKMANKKYPDEALAFDTSNIDDIREHYEFMLSHLDLKRKIDKHRN
jgi:hypothetical protein